MENNGFIRLQDLSKSYQEGERTHTVLKNASASFARGEFTAILGKSGSGKSTLLNLISGIDQADAGSVCINGQDITLMGDRQRTLLRRHKIGFIFQFYNLIPTLSVIENTALPGELSGLSPKNARKRSIPLLQAVGLAERVDTFPDRLSGGEQQRVAIARALVNDPILLLADEPTGNLDEDTGKQILEMLDRLTRQAGKNIILVTHNQDAAAFADRILYLKDGCLLSK